MAKAIVIDWYGPYKSLDDLKGEVTSWDRGKALYMVMRPGKKPKYIGISRNIATRHNNKHKIFGLDDEKKHHYYCAEVTSQAVAGRITGTHSADLLLAEQLLIAFLEPKLNQQHKHTHPDDCVSVFSRFFGKNNGEKPKLKPKNFPAMIAFNSWSEQYWVSKEKSIEL